MSRDPAPRHPAPTPADPRRADPTPADRRVARQRRREHTRSPQPAPSVPARSPRAATVARWFGLRADARGPAAAAARAFAMPPHAADALHHRPPGTITLVTGPSGSGKSSLLRALTAAPEPGRRAPATTRWIDVAALPLRDVPVVDCFGPAAPLPVVLTLLGRLGLGEAWTYLRTPGELSDGQRWRLRLALAIRNATSADATASAARPVLVADEFAALLDRVTAAIVARALRRLIDAHPAVAAVVATSHDDLAAALRPDVTVRCDFTTIRVERREPPGGRGPHARIGR